MTSNVSIQVGLSLCKLDEFLINGEFVLYQSILLKLKHFKVYNSGHKQLLKTLKKALIVTLLLFLDSGRQVNIER